MDVLTHWWRYKESWVFKFITWKGVEIGGFVLAFEKESWWVRLWVWCLQQACPRRQLWGWLLTAERIWQRRQTWFWSLVVLWLRGFWLGFWGRGDFQRCVCCRTRLRVYGIPQPLLVFVVCHVSFWCLTIFYF